MFCLITLLGISLCGLLRRFAHAMYIVTWEVAVTFLLEVVAQIWLDPLRASLGCWETFIKYFFWWINSFMPFLASNCLHNLWGQKWLFLCHHAIHLQQIHWSKLLCGMHGFTPKSSISRLNILRLLIRFTFRSIIWIFTEGEGDGIQSRLSS